MVSLYEGATKIDQPRSLLCVASGLCSNNDVDHAQGPGTWPNHRLWVQRQIVQFDAVLSRPRPGHDIHHGPPSNYRLACLPVLTIVSGLLQPRSFLYSHLGPLCDLSQAVRPAQGLCHVVVQRGLSSKSCLSHLICCVSNNNPKARRSGADPLPCSSISQTPSRSLSPSNRIRPAGLPSSTVRLFRVRRGRSLHVRCGVVADPSRAPSLPFPLLCRSQPLHVRDGSA